MEKITKAVIACAGFGTRFLPATKAVPKELFPVVDTPVLAFIVNEAKKSGITDVLIVTSKCKEVIKNYFSPNKELDKMLEKTGKSDVMKAINDNGVNVSFVYQTEPKGTADAVACAKEFTKDEPFVLAWGDDLIDASVPVMKQLIDAYDLVKTPIIGVQNIQGDEIVKYGVAKIKRTDGKLSLLEGFVEKPELFELPSRQASLGRYVLTPAIYDAISRISKYEVGLEGPSTQIRPKYAQSISAPPGIDDLPCWGEASPLLGLGISPVRTFGLPCWRGGGALAEWAGCPYGGGGLPQRKV